MDRLQKRVIRKALRRHQRIFPCRSQERLEDCFTSDGRQLVFWYNTEDRTTHALTCRIPGRK